MRSTKCLYFVLTASFLCHVMPTQADETSKVIPETTAIHSQASVRSRVTGSLERGHLVAIDLMITGSEGSWCLVREPDQKSAAGYVLCNHLTREALPKTESLRQVPQPMQPIRSKNPAADKAEAGEPTSNAEVGTLEHWAAELGLSQGQREAVLQSYESSGIAACRDDLEAAYRRHGVTDPYSLFQQNGEFVKNPARFAAAVEPKIQRGAARYKLFWQQFWKILTPEQRERATHITSLFVAYIVSQSDPETAFGGSVLQHMRHSPPAK